MVDQGAQSDAPAVSVVGSGLPVGGPVSAGWRECTLTRVKELDTLCSWASANHEGGNDDVFVSAIAEHLAAAKDAAELAAAKPKQRFPFLRGGALHDRAMSNLDAAEAQILNFAPATYVLGQFPGLLAHVQRHLIPTDPRRTEFERIARQLGVKQPDHSPVHSAGEGERVLTREQEKEIRRRTVNQDRGQIVTSVRAASSAALREQVRLRSFRDVLVVTTLLMALLAAGIAIVGAIWPTMIPLCFAPEDGGQAVVVCPTAQSAPFATASPKDGGTSASATQLQDIDDAVRSTVSPRDLLVVELVGLAAASVAAAAAIRGIRGSSERYGLPVALAVLKLPTGAITAFLGLLLMRGQFVPGLSALDTSAQILAWAVVFGYAQQLFTRLVDQQGQSVLNSVRGADKAKPPTSTP